MCQQCGTTFRVDDQLTILAAESKDWPDEAPTLDVATSLYQEGEKYQLGLDVPVNHAKAASLYLEAANPGSSEAKEQLEFIYDSLPIDELKALSEAGDAGAEAELGDRFQDLAFDADIVENDDMAAETYWKQSTYWFSLAAEHGSPRGLSGLASAYFHGNGIDKDIDKGLELCKESAAAGYSYADDQLLIMQEHLKKVGDEARAAVEKEEQLQKDIQAAEAGEKDALRRAGIALNVGNPPRDRQLGLSFLRKVAEAEVTGKRRDVDDRRYAGTMYLLAMFLEGETWGSTKEEQREAFSWLLKGYAEGDQLCSFALGEHAARGKGCTKNLMLAQWAFEDAAERNYEANHELGLIYFEKGYFQAAVSQFTCAISRKERSSSKQKRDELEIESVTFRAQAERHLSKTGVEMARLHGEALAEDKWHVQLKCEEFERRMMQSLQAYDELWVTSDGLRELYFRFGGIYSLAWELLMSRRAEFEGANEFVTEESFKNEGLYPFGFFPRPNLSEEAPDPPDPYQ